MPDFDRFFGQKGVNRYPISILRPDFCASILTRLLQTCIFYYVANLATCSVHGWESEDNYPYSSQRARTIHVHCAYNGDRTRPEQDEAVMPLAEKRHQLGAAGVRGDTRLHESPETVTIITQCHGAVSDRGTEPPPRSQSLSHNHCVRVTGSSQSVALMPCSHLIRGCLPIRRNSRASPNMLTGWSIGHPVLRNGHPVI